MSMPTQSQSENEVDEHQSRMHTGRALYQSDEKAFSVIMLHLASDCPGDLLLWEKIYPQVPWPRILCLWLLLGRPELSKYRALLGESDPTIGLRFLDYIPKSLRGDSCEAGSSSSPINPTP